jgi:RHS repeat-associated protein
MKRGPGQRSRRLLSQCLCLLLLFETGPVLALPRTPVPEEIHARHSVARVRQSYAYTLGPAGNRTRIDEQDGTVRSYEYDPLYRLTSETVSTGGALVYRNAFTYDPVGNRLAQDKTGETADTIAYANDERDRLVAEDGAAWNWDQNGNLAAKPGPEGTAYVWDFEDRLVQVTTADGTVVTHAYDADGNRVLTEVTPPTGPPVATRYLVDTSGPLSHVVTETTGGELTAYYVRGDDLLAVLRSTGTRHFHADGLGSIRALTDETRALTDTYAFTAFGELHTHTGTGPNAYLFAGEMLDPNSGFYYLRARWMDPGVGRFASIDPNPGLTSDPATLHRYFYAKADPVNWLDPTGETAVAVGGFGEIGIVQAAAALVAAMVVVAVAKELIRRIPIRANHYTRKEILPLITSGGINSPSGKNYFTPDFYFSASLAKARLALPKRPDLVINLTLFPNRDRLSSIRQVDPDFGEPGGGREFSTARKISFWSRLPVVLPLGE